MALPADYDSMSPSQQMLWLFNSEREVRGLSDLQLDSTLMSQIALNHSQEMAQYGYFEHSSPINQGQNIGERECVNPALAVALTNCGWENIAARYRNSAEAVFGYMYDDSSSGYGQPPEHPRGAQLGGDRDRAKRARQPVGKLLHR